MPKDHAPPEEGEPSDNLYICGLPAEFDNDSVQQFFGAIGNVIQCKSFGNGFALVRFATLEEAVTVKLSLHGQKPIGCTKPMSITFAVTTGKNDWNCPQCGDLQFSKNAQCRLCGCPRPGPGEMPAPGAAVPAFGKAKGKGKPMGGPFGGAKGAAKGAAKGGPMCSMADFINELISGGLPGGDQDPNQNCIYVGGLPSDTSNEHLYQIFATFGSIPPKGTTVEADANGKCAGWGLVNFIEGTSADMAVMALHGIVLPDGNKLEVRKK